MTDRPAGPSRRRATARAVASRTYPPTAAWTTYPPGPEGLGFTAAECDEIVASATPEASALIDGPPEMRLLSGPCRHTIATITHLEWLAERLDGIFGRC